MTTNEVITGVLSITALIVSLLSFYLTYFHKSAHAIGVLVSRNHQAGGKYPHALEYSLSNTGNLQLILTEADLILGESSTYYGNSYHGPPQKSKGPPCIIEPGQIKMVSITFDEKELLNSFLEGDKCFAHFHIISSRGRVYDILHDVSEMKDPDEPWGRKAWQPFRMGQPW